MQVFRCPRCKAELPRLSEELRSTPCGSCFVTVHLVTCARTDWTGPVLSLWKTFKHPGCSWSHINPAHLKNWLPNAEAYTVSGEQSPEEKAQAKTRRRDGLIVLGGIVGVSVIGGIILSLTGGSDIDYKPDSFQMSDHCAEYLGTPLAADHDNGMSSVKKQYGDTYSVELYTHSGTYVGSCTVEKTPTKFLVSQGPYDSEGNPQ